MAKAIIRYDKDLPEIRGRNPWERPTSYLVKDDAVASGWRVDTSGRRPSRLLLVPKIRAGVNAWRATGYKGASDITRRLLRYWFEEDHVVSGFDIPLRYYFCQREAIETLVWLIEIAGQRDTWELIKARATIFKSDLFAKDITLQTKMEGPRQIRRYVPEIGADGLQDLPPENLRRFAFKMATGSGKTWVMAMAIVWAHFHKRRVPDSDLSTNFLIVAPNVIVYQRLERDFANNRIFNKLPLIPPEWRGAFSQRVILRDDAAEPNRSGNLFLTNIHQLYEWREAEWTPQNAIEALLGKRPPRDAATSGQRSMLERVKTLNDLIVLNDEAHHVHDETLAWSKSVLAIHRTQPKGLSLWLDLSATPKDQNGMYFPWTVCDYPLAQAVEDRIVKAPLVVTNEYDSLQPRDDPDGVTRYNVCEKYGYWIRAAVQRWKEHNEVYKHLGKRPVLFIMAEKSVHANAIGKYLQETGEFGFTESEVLIIHTDAKGLITKRDLERARTAARDIDRAESKIRVIVSVMMLREGWDVRNVTVVLGLRPFTARSEILPEQVIGRGLRLMANVSPDQTQTLEVLGTRNLLSVLRTQLEVEGVGVVTSKTDPPLPVIITPTLERTIHDIAIPITKPSLEHDIHMLSELRVEELDGIYDPVEIAEPHRVKLKLDFATTETEIHQADVATRQLLPGHELLASITNKVISRANLPTRFAELYPAVRKYVTTRCFGKSIVLDDTALRSHLARPELQERIANYLAARFTELTIERRALKFEKADFRLSQTIPFSWRRNLPPLEATKTVFNYVATYNDFERQFAKFLDQAKDVARFAALGTTGQGRSGTQFRVDYLKPSGAIGFYRPDWIVVQKTALDEENLIIETKGRVWGDTAAKDDAIKTWCDRVTDATGQTWRYTRINQRDFKVCEGDTLAQLINRQRAQ